MENNLWSGALAGLIAATGLALAAQTTPTPSQTPSKSAAPNSITVTGCLQPVDQSSTGAEKSPSDANIKFQLAKVAQSDSAEAVGTSGTKAPKASSYRLEGDDSKLSPHVGHKVEITGTASSDAKLKVDSIRMVAASCSE